MSRNPSATRVEIEQTNLSEHGQRYRVTYDGEVLADGRRNPIFDACRALLARGIIGRLEGWRRARQALICNSISSVALAWPCGNRKNTVSEPWIGAPSSRMPFPRVRRSRRRPWTKIEPA